jgi:hypothetical protein
MNKLTLSILGAVGLCVAAAGLAGPARADDSAAVQVNNLESSGYKVILNKIGAAPLDQCIVTSVVPGGAITTPVTAGEGSLTDQVEYTTVFRHHGLQRPGQARATVTARCPRLFVPDRCPRHPRLRERGLLC